MPMKFWKKHPHAKAEGGKEARIASEEALIRAKAQRQRAEDLTRRVVALKNENHFSGKIEYLIMKGRG